MLPGGPLAKKQLSKLKMYYGEKHPHSSQNPIEINFSKINKKIKIKLMNQTNLAKPNKSKKIKFRFQR